MTKEQEQAIRKLEAGFEGKIDRLFFMEEISQKKLRNAINSYAQGFKKGETPVYLWDDTFFGSAKEGFLLTDRRIYQKNNLDAPSSSGIHEIVDFELERTISSYFLTPVGTSTLKTIQMIYKCAYQESVPTRLTQMIHILTGRTAPCVCEETAMLTASGGQEETAMLTALSGQEETEMPKLSGKSSLGTSRQRRRRSVSRPDLRANRQKVTPE